MRNAQNDGQTNPGGASYPSGVLLLHQFQRNGGTRAGAFLRSSLARSPFPRSAFLRSPFLRSSFLRSWGIRHPGGLDLVQHRIAQNLQFRILDFIEFDPKFEDRNSHQLRRIPVAALHEGHLAFLKGGQNLVHHFFRASHQPIFRL